MVFGARWLSLRYAVSSVLIYGALCFAALAQTHADASDDAAQIRERLVPEAAPRSRSTANTIEIPRTLEPDENTRGIELVVASVVVDGASVFPRESLLPITSPLEGKKTSLAAVYEAANAITKLYRDRGFVLSRAFIPPQNLDRTGAIVRIRIIEGFIDEVVWPEDAIQYRNVFSYYAKAITAERPSNIKTIERYLLLANELPGLRFHSALRASERTRGAATLVVTAEYRALDVAASIDNRGTVARGPYQAVGLVTLNNLLGSHEQMEFVAAATSDLSELQFFSGSVSTLLHPEGLRAKATLSYSAGRPGLATLRALAFGASSLAFESGLSYPVIRSRDRNLTLSVLAYATDSDATALGTTFTQDRVRGLRARAEYDFADTLGGINQFRLTVSQGIAGLGATSFGNANASRTAGRPDAAKLELYASRLQPLPGRFSLFAQAEFQYAFAPLLAPEECGYGGSRFGRAFDPAVLSGDHCAVVSGEVRYDVPVQDMAFTDAVSLRALQLYAYGDFGAVRRIAPAAGTLPSASASSWGFGARSLLGSHAGAGFEIGQVMSGPTQGEWRAFFNLTLRN